MASNIRKILIGNEELIYRLKSYRRSKRVRLLFYGNGEVSVTKPLFVSEKAVENIILSKADWLLEKVKKGNNLSSGGVQEQYIKNKKIAAKIVKERLEFFNQFYGFKYGKISIRKQRTRWGSCSKEGNLSFNFRLALLRPEESDYIIVHELCHIKEFNHSEKFWSLVEKTIPNYKILRRKLKVV